MSHEQVNIEALITAGQRVEVLMDTLALLGWPQQLPPAYKRDWAQFHQDLRRALGMVHEWPKEA